MTGSELIRCEPNLENFTKSLLNLGYSHYVAILDLIDNSIAAGATKVWVRYQSEKDETKIIISDNGTGMTESTLFEAMRIASADPNSMRSSDNDLGKFGLGLKLASFSLSDKFQVISKTPSTTFSSYQWDLDVVRSNNDWLIQKIQTEAWYAQIERPSGTDVVLHKIRDSISDLDKVKDKLRYHLATVYFNFNKVEFYVEDKKVEPIDIFFRSHRASNQAEVDAITHNGVRVLTQSFQIPHQDKLNVRQRDDFNGIAEIGMTEGIYLFRKNRLIAWAGWEGLGSNKRIGDLHRLAIYIDQAADKLFNIEVKKSQISILDDALRRKIQQKIHIFSNTARRPYKQRAKTNLQEVINIWKIEQEDGRTQISIDRSNKVVKSFLKNELAPDSILKLVEGTLPFDSLLYYLNTDKIDREDVRQKKLEAIKTMYANGLMSEQDYQQNLEKYG